MHADRGAAGGRRGYIPGIDGLRAIAVLSVILFHMRGALLPGGYTGVDVFFVISGYVVSSSLVQHGRARFLPFILGFYARRIVRIYPALLACVLVTGIVQTLIVPSSWLSQTTAKTALAAIFGVSNIALIWLNDGYFSPRVEFNAFTHTWSLGVEEQFYLVFPVVFYLWLRRDGFRPAVSKAVSASMAALLLASLAWCAFETAAQPDRAYYLLPSRFWELACGALLFRWHHAGRGLAMPPAAAGACIAAGLASIAAGFVGADAKLFPFPWALPSVLGAMLVVAGVVGDAAGRSLPGRLMAGRAIRYVGKTSYSLYLWHWPVLVMFRWTVGLDTVQALLAAGAITGALGVLSYHGIENPVRRSRWVTGRSDRRVVFAGVAVMALCCVLLAGVFKSRAAISLSVTRDERTWYPEPWPASATGGEKPLAGRKLFVLGDSHTGAYSTMLRRLQDETGAQVFQYGQGGCTVANLLVPAIAGCARFAQGAAAEIEKNAAPGDVVFLASLRVPRLADQWEVFRGAEPADPARDASQARQRALAFEEADALVGRFEKEGLRVVIDAPKPVFKSPPFRCSDWFNAHNPICAGGLTMGRAFLQAHRQPTMDALALLQARHPGMLVWDPFPALCPGETCAAFDGDKPLFFDGDHLSAHGNRVLYPGFLKALAPLWSEGRAG
jgi:peptidoglycan/LPS O-acetylase OafA/YrhL